MIPVRLTLFNFLSYGDAVEPIDFTGLSIACLSGSNGHGKSALLDAITWSLWGQARTASADDLVRLGQSSMLVEFEFDFDGHRYRAIRKRTRGKSGQSDLQFQIRGDDESFRSLTEQGVRATQERITQTLRMDYETFINSAFILQGRADEFARKGATDRKRILSEILNLRVYDELMEEARVRAREAEQVRVVLDGELARIDAELAEEPRHREAITACQARLLEIQTRYQEREAERAQLATRKIELETVQLRASDLGRRVQEAENDLRTWRAQHATVEARLMASRVLVAEGEAIRRQVEQLTFARAQEAHCQRQFAELRRLQAERAVVEKAVLEARLVLEGDLRAVRKEVEVYEGRRVELPLRQAEERELAARVQTLDRLEEEAEALARELAEAREERAALLSAAEQWSRALAEAEERFLFLKRAEARCPVCEGDLNPEQRRDLGWRVRQEKEALQARIAEAEQTCRTLTQRIDTLDRQTKTAQSKRKTGQLWREQHAQKRQQILQLEASLEELPGALARQAQLEARLESGDFSPEKRRELDALDERIRAVGYDEAAHQAVGERIRELQPAEGKLARLVAAEESLDADVTHSAALAESIAKREGEIAQDRADEAELRRQAAELPEVARQHARVDSECAAILHEAAAATRDLGAAQDRLKRCEELRAEAVEKRRARDAASRDKVNYDDLVRIFGRNGIQALIIENAIPEIEMEANAILERMTDNGMKVTLRTQRDTKTAGVAETLDIEISDEVGTRKYELFSGGEALRVNFALRIALSKLLARRAGARLQTLVIDEGFGSQDATGRDKLVEAIHSIQDDFEKILIITHLDELKDAFPTRLEVTKDHRGSHVTLI